MRDKIKIPCQRCSVPIIRWPNNRKYCDACKEIAYKESKAAYAKEYQKINRPKINEYNRLRYASNPARSLHQWKKWRDKDIDGYRERRRENYRENPEIYRKHASDHYKKNKDECDKRSRVWKRHNPEKVKEMKRRSYWKNRDHVLEYKRKNNERIKECRRNWCDRNRLHVRIKNQNRRALKLMSVGTHTEQEFLVSCKMHDWTCAYCGVEVDKQSVTEDHVIPLSRGGNNSIDNIVPSCGHCNISKGNKSLLEFIYSPEIRKVA